MLRVSALVLSAASWLVVLRGLWFAPVSSDPAVDLEGGGSFAANVDVYLPALVLTLVFLTMFLAGAAKRGWQVAVLVVSITTAAFSAWTLSRDYVLDWRPSLDNHLAASIVLAAIACILVVLSATDPTSSEADTP